MEYKNIREDFFYEIIASSVTYTIYDGDFVIYSGRAYCNPDTGRIRINVAQRVRDYLENEMPDFRDYDGVIVYHPEAIKTFRLVDDAGSVLETYCVLMEWDREFDGGDMIMSNQVTQKIDPRMKIFWGMWADGDRDILFEICRELEIIFDVEIPIWIHSSGGTVNVGYTANTEYEFSYDGGGWFTAVDNGGYITITADANEGDDRQGSICFTYTGLGFEVKTKCYPVVQDNAIPYFIIEPSWTMYGWEDMKTVTATTNVTGYTITTAAEWVEGTVKHYTGTTASIDILTEIGDMFSGRTAVFNVYYEGEFLATFTLTQTALDTGSAIIGISDTATTYYYKGSERSGVTPEYSGVCFYSKIFSGPAPYDASSGYVETRNGIISHIGPLGSDDSINATATKQLEYDRTVLDFVEFNYLAGGYGTVIFPLHMTHLDSGYTIQDSLDERLYVPEGIHTINGLPVINGQFVGQGGKYIIKNIYWNSPIGIIDSLCSSSLSLEYVYIHQAYSVGNYAFRNDRVLTAVDGLGNVISIGVEAFKGDVLLSGIEINNEAAIMYGAFEGCTSLPGFYFGRQQIYGRAFKEAAFGFTGDTLYIGSGVTFDSYGGYAEFFRASGFTVVEAHTYTLNPMAFMQTAVETANLSGVTLMRTGDPLWGTVLRYGPFAYCDRLATVDAPDLVTASGGAFRNCPSLTSVYVPKVKTLQGGYYEYGVTFDSYGDFSDCTSLASIDLPSIEYVGDYTFYHCYSLESVHFGSGLTYIGTQAFYACSSLTSITADVTMSQFENMDIPASGWVSGAIECVQCTDGVLHHSWEYENGNVVHKPIDYTNVTAETYSRNEMRFTSFPAAASLQKMVFDGDVSLYPSSGRLLINAPLVNEMTFNGDAVLYRIGGDSTKIWRFNSGEVEIMDQGYDAYGYTSRVSGIYVGSGVTSITFDGSCLKGNTDFTDIQITYEGTMSQWNSICHFYSNWNRNSNLNTVHCTDGDISV